MATHNTPGYDADMTHRDDEATPTYKPVFSPARSNQDDMNRAILEALQTIRHVDRDMAALTAEVKRLAQRRNSEETTDEVYRKSLEDYITDQNDGWAAAERAVDADISSGITFANKPLRKQQQHVNFQQRQQQQRNEQQEQQQQYIPDQRKSFSSFPDRQTFDQSTADGRESWFSKKMGYLIPTPNSFATITKSVVPANPRTSQVRLKHLNFESVFHFLNDFMKEQQSYPDFELSMGSYLTVNVMLQIQAFDEQICLTGTRVVISGDCIKMPNELLCHLLLKIVAPKSTEDFERELQVLVRFPMLPNHYVVDPLKWQWMYEAFLLFFHRFQDVYSLLTSNPEANHSPIFKTHKGRLGLMDILLAKIPNELGKYMSEQIPVAELKQCTDIIVFIGMMKRLNQHYYDVSIAAELDRRRLFKSKKDDVNLQDVSLQYPKPVYPSARTPTTVPSSTPSNTTTPRSPAYTNPHASTPNNNHNLYKMSRDHPDDSYEHNNPYDNPYDLYDEYVDKPVIAIKTPLTHVYDDFERELFSLDPQDLPCFEYFRTGKCLASREKPCPYNHTVKRMHDKWLADRTALDKSPFNPNIKTPFKSVSTDKPTSSPMRVMSRSLNIVDTPSAPAISPFIQFGSYSPTHPNPTNVDHYTLEQSARRVEFDSSVPNSNRDSTDA
jgi:hypothetical protein